MWAMAVVTLVLMATGVAAVVVATSGAHVERSVRGQARGARLPVSVYPACWFLLGGVRKALRSACQACRRCTPRRSSRKLVASMPKAMSGSR